jgi:catechol 2,3-dioxygenase-like lactoylglutathione lyase family enzyme
MIKEILRLAKALDKMGYVEQANRINGMLKRAEPSYVTDIREELADLKADPKTGIFRRRSYNKRVKELEDKISLYENLLSHKEKMKNKSLEAEESARQENEAAMAGVLPHLRLMDMDEMTGELPGEGQPDPLQVARDTEFRAPSELPSLPSVFETERVAPEGEIATDDWLDKRRERIIGTSGVLSDSAGYEYSIKDLEKLWTHEEDEITFRVTRVPMGRGGAGVGYVIRKHSRYKGNPKDPWPRLIEKAKKKFPKPAESHVAHRGNTIWRLGHWQQKRSPDGTIIGYKADDMRDWQTSRMMEATPGPRGTSTRHRWVQPGEEVFRLGLGRQFGERSVGNIGHEPLNSNEWEQQ